VWQPAGDGRGDLAAAAAGDKVFFKTVVTAGGRHPDLLQQLQVNNSGCSLLASGSSHPPGSPGDAPLRAASFLLGSPPST
jgi:hypothetical protein